MSPASATLPAGEPPRRRSAHPQRTCVACRRTRDKQDLVRLARHGDDVVVDWDQTAPGRGSSICPDLDCVEQATARDAARLRASLRGGTVDQVLCALTEIHHHLESAQHSKEHNA
nr:YlxR family protein [Salsipaludibacter albus]